MTLVLPVRKRTLSLEQTSKPLNKLKSLCLAISRTLNQPVLSRALNRTDCAFTSTRSPATLLQAGLSPPGPPITYRVRQRGSRGRRWMPLSVLFTLVNLLLLSNCPVISICDYVSPVFHLTDTCPARSNGRTLIGALDIQTLYACSLLYVRLSPYAPPFYRHRPTSGSGQPFCSPRTRRP